MMLNQPEAQKLKALRSKTDGQLIALLNHQLDQGLRADFATAEQMHRNVSQLLPVVFGISPAEYWRLEAKLARLGASLHHVCASVA